MSIPPLDTVSTTRWTAGIMPTGSLLMASGARVLGLVGFVVLLYGADALATAALSTYLNVRSPEAQRVPPCSPLIPGCSVP